MITIIRYLAASPTRATALARFSLLFDPTPNWIKANLNVDPILSLQFSLELLPASDFVATNISIGVEVHC